MTDIVKRLRSWTGSPDDSSVVMPQVPVEVLVEAAAEIERLHKELAAFERCYVSVEEVLKAKSRDAEIERLREQLKAQSDAWHEQEEEIERLRGLLKDAPCTCPNPPPHDWPHDPNNEECYRNRVREALREKP